MFAKTLVLISTVIASSVLMAAEGGEHGGGHYSELLPKIVNFGLVFGFMLWKIKKPVSEMFTKNSRDVSSLFQVAEQKDKEAQIKLETYERKLASVAAEKGKILENAQAEASAFEKKISMETAATLEKMKKDNAAKVQAEQNALTAKLGAELIEEVIVKTKTTVKSNKGSQEKATQNLMAQLS